MFKAFLSVSGFTILSRITGFLRDWVLAVFVGANGLTDAFFVAFRIPNHFRAIVGEGAFQAAFVPMVAGVAERQGREPALAFAGLVLGVLVPINLVLLLVLTFFSREVVMLIAPGYGDNPDQLALASALLILTAPYLICMSICALYSSVLNSLGRFAAAAGAPVLLNVIMAAGVLALPPFMPVTEPEQPAYALAISVFVSGVAQVVFLAVIMARHGMPVRLSWPHWTKEIREFFRRLGPALLGSGVAEISVFIDTIIASFLTAGSISYLWYADRLNQLPLAIIGIALGTVLLPRLSQLFAAGDEKTASGVLSKSLEVGLLLGFPSAVVFAIASEPLVAGLFGYRAFGAEDVAGTAVTLQAYAVGLAPFILVRCLIPTFYARGDTATPVRVAAVALTINILIKIALIDPFGFKILSSHPLGPEGIALGTAAGAIVNAVLLGFILARRGLLVLDGDLLRRAATIVAAGGVMGGALYGLPMAFEAISLQGGIAARLLHVGAIVVVGGVVYAVALEIFRYPLLRELRTAFTRRKIAAPKTDVPDALPPAG